MPARRVTALRETRRGLVEVELDGAPWRRLPVGAVAAAGLVEGCLLDRERARRLARGRKRGHALAVATRALAQRPLSTAELDERLARRRVAPRERAAARETLASAGYLDDARFALARAETLAAKGAGDALIAHDLEARGVDAPTVHEALAALAPEEERAREAVERRGRSARTARWLAARGFSEDAIAAAVGDVASGPDDVVG